MLAAVRCARSRSFSPKKNKTISTMTYLYIVYVCTRSILYKEDRAEIIVVHWRLSSRNKAFVMLFFSFLLSAHATSHRYSRCIVMVCICASDRLPVLAGRRRRVYSRSLEEVFVVEEPILYLYVFSARHTVRAFSIRMCTRPYGRRRNERVT